MQGNYIAFWNEIPVVGGLLGGIFGNPEEDAHQKALKQARQDMYAYRPEAMQANMNVMGNMAHAFEPMNNMMGQAYGPQAQMDWSKMVQNPFSADAQSRMMQQAHPQPAQKPQGGNPGVDSMGVTTARDSNNMPARKFAWER